VSHLICNAGLASFTKVDLLKFANEFFTDPFMALTMPEYYGQVVGELSTDGLGWIWQCNAFGHYALVRTISMLIYRVLMCSVFSFGL